MRPIAIYPAGRGSCTADGLPATTPPPGGGEGTACDVLGVPAGSWINFHSRLISKLLYCDCRTSTPFIRFSVRPSRSGNLRSSLQVFAPPEGYVCPRPIFVSGAESYCRAPLETCRHFRVMFRLSAACRRSIVRVPTSDRHLMNDGREGMTE